MTKNVLKFQNLKITKKQGLFNKKIILNDLSFDISANLCTSFVAENISEFEFLKNFLILKLPYNYRIVGGSATLNDNNQEKSKVLFNYKGHKNQGIDNRLVYFVEKELFNYKPRWTVYRYLIKVYLKNNKLPEAKGKKWIYQLLNLINIKNPFDFLNKRLATLNSEQHFKLSMIKAVLHRPKLILLEKPLDNLILRVKHDVLSFWKKIVSEQHYSLLVFTDNLLEAVEISEQIYVFSNSRIVEYGASQSVINFAQHPLTWSLIAAFSLSKELNPFPIEPLKINNKENLITFSGDLFVAKRLPFYAQKNDSEMTPPLVQIFENHYAASWLLAKSGPYYEPPNFIKKRWEFFLLRNAAIRPGTAEWKKHIECSQEEIDKSPILNSSNNQYFEKFFSPFANQSLSLIINNKNLIHLEDFGKLLENKNIEIPSRKWQYQFMSSEVKRLTQLTNINKTDAIPIPNEEYYEKSITKDKTSEIFPQPDAFQDLSLNSDAQASVIKDLPEKIKTDDAISNIYQFSSLVKIMFSDDMVAEEREEWLRERNLFKEKSIPEVPLFSELILSKTFFPLRIKIFHPKENSDFSASSFVEKAKVQKKKELASSFSIFGDEISRVEETDNVQKLNNNSGSNDFVLIPKTQVHQKPLEKNFLPKNFSDENKMGILESHKTPSKILEPPQNIQKKTAIIDPLIINFYPEKLNLKFEPETQQSLIQLEETTTDQPLLVSEAIEEAFIEEAETEQLAAEFNPEKYLLNDNQIMPTLLKPLLHKIVLNHKELNVAEGFLKKTEIYKEQPEIEQPKKRPRGRPRKIRLTSEIVLPKRPRGRPKKILNTMEISILQERKLHPRKRGRPRKIVVDPVIKPLKFHRGRPRKLRDDLKLNLVKRKRGRPRKTDALQLSLLNLNFVSQQYATGKSSLSNNSSSKFKKKKFFIKKNKLQYLQKRTIYDKKSK